MNLTFLLLTSDQYAAELTCNGFFLFFTNEEIYYINSIYTDIEKKIYIYAIYISFHKKIKKKIFFFPIILIQTISKIVNRLKKKMLLNIAFPEN